MSLVASKKQLLIEEMGWLHRKGFDTQLADLFYKIKQAKERTLLTSQLFEEKNSVGTNMEGNINSFKDNLKLICAILIENLWKMNTQTKLNEKGIFELVQQYLTEKSRSYSRGSGNTCKIRIRDENTENTRSKENVKWLKNPKNDLPVDGDESYKNLATSQSFCQISTSNNSLKHYSSVKGGQFQTQNKPIKSLYLDLSSVDKAKNALELEIARTSIKLEKAPKRLDIIDNEAPTEHLMLSKLVGSITQNKNSKLTKLSSYISKSLVGARKNYTRNTGIKSHFHRPLRTQQQSSNISRNYGKNSKLSESYTIGNTSLTNQSLRLSISNSNSSLLHSEKTTLLKTLVQSDLKYNKKKEESGTILRKGNQKAMITKPGSYRQQLNKSKTPAVSAESRNIRKSSLNKRKYKCFSPEARVTII